VQLRSLLMKKKLRDVILIYTAVMLLVLLECVARNYHFPPYREVWRVEWPGVDMSFLCPWLSSGGACKEKRPPSCAALAVDPNVGPGTREGAYLSCHHRRPALESIIMAVECSCP
jgi:hypothetical protein